MSTVFYLIILFQMNNTVDSYRYSMPDSCCNDDFAEDAVCDSESAGKYKFDRGCKVNNSINKKSNFETRVLRTMYEIIK